jgi:glutamate carboxypeptidase
MEQYNQHLDHLDSQRELVCDVLSRWSGINSFSNNSVGIDRMVQALEADFSALQGIMEIVEVQPQNSVGSSSEPLPLRPVKALRVRKRQATLPSVFLCGHMDTVFPPDHPFQHPVRESDLVLRGPGVTDAKGGLLVMLKALEAFERSPWADKLGWEVLVNSDEEVGSPGSAGLLAEAAARNDLGLVFEPSFSDGNLVAARKGSGNFTVMITGRAAHAGREPHLGRNAINAMAEFVVELNSLSRTVPGVFLNVGLIEGGGPVNVVPDRALCRFNVRVTTPEEQDSFQAHLDRTKEKIASTEGISVTVMGRFTRPPKPLDDRSLQLLSHIAGCGRDLGLSLEWRPSGGACDGNNLAALGLPVVDSMGPVGSGIHSSHEFVLLDSVMQRAKLTALFLMKLASGAIKWPVAR